MISGFGGGFFFGPFTSTQGFGTYTMLPNALPGVYGAWAHLVVPIPTGSGRWLEASVWPNAYGAIYLVQVGLGALGAEKPFQPSDGTGFYIDWFSGIKWIVPFRISFPTSMLAGQEICCRCASVPGGINQLTANIYLWN